MEIKHLRFIPFYWATQKIDFWNFLCIFVNNYGYIKISWRYSLKIQCYLNLFPLSMVLFKIRFFFKHYKKYIKILKQNKSINSFSHTDNLLFTLGGYIPSTYSQFFLYVTNNKNTNTEQYINKPITYYVLLLMALLK